MLGPCVLGYIPGFMETFYPSQELPVFNTLATFSILYYVFLLAVRMDPIQIFKTAKYAWGIGLATFVMPFFIVSCLYLLLKDHLPKGYNGTRPVMTLAMMAATSLSDNIITMNELNFLTSELGRVSTSVAAVNEIVMWFFTLVAHRSGKVRQVPTVVCFLIFGVVLFCVLRPIVLWVNRKTPEDQPVNEGIIVTLLLGCAISAFMSDMIGMGYLPGVLIMGLIIPVGHRLGSALIERSEFFIEDFFLHFLFLSIGRATDVSQIRDGKALAAVLLIIIASYVGKLIAVCVGSLNLAMKSSNVLILGLMLNMKGPIEIIFFTRQLTDQFVDCQFYTQVVFAYILISAVGSRLLQNLYRPNVRLEVASSSKLSLRSLLSARMRGEFRVLCCIHSEEDVQCTISLLEAMNPTEGNPMCAYVIHATKLVGRVTPLLAPYKHHRKFSKHNSTNRILRAFMNYASNEASPKSITVQPFTLIAPYGSMHDSICLQAQNNVIPLIILPFHENQAAGTRGGIRNVNYNILAYAPCTVGIMVRRNNFSHRMICTVTLPHFSYTVALIFFGGDDDREALTLADRMLGHPCVSMTVLRIVYAETDQDRNNPSSHLDDILFTEFREKNSGNACVAFNDVSAGNPVEVINAVNLLTDPYDLVIVGKKPSSSARFEEEVGNWMEYPELGVIGDMIASSDFCGGAMSVLVLQHYPTGDGNEDDNNGRRGYASLADDAGTYEA